MNIPQQRTLRIICAGNANPQNLQRIRKILQKRQFPFRGERVRIFVKKEVKVFWESDRFRDVRRRCERESRVPYELTKSPRPYILNDTYGYFI